ncbi:MAG: hypothetical protein M0004_04320 [Actinomycetota bacterium]|nr:hypothetical protein [Actinomycetota bacterium]
MPYHRPGLLSADELHRLGDRIIVDLYHGAALEACTVLALADVLVAAAMTATLSPEAAFALVASAVAAKVEAGDYSQQSANKLLGLQRRLAKFLTARGVADIRAANRRSVELWLKASIPVAGGGVRPPDTRTIDNRIWAADAFFFALRQLDCYEGHPLLDIEHPVRPKGHCRPLTDGEVDLGRRFARRDLRDTRGPAAWAVVEAGASTGELMRVTVADVTARPGHCWLTGDRRRLARFVELTPSGLVAVEARARSLGDGPDRLLIYEGAGSAESQQASASKVIGDALRRSGVARDAAVKPSSLRAFAGLSAYHRTGDITAAAAVLGCRSLDDAATIIGWEPEQAPEPPPHRVRP